MARRVGPEVLPAAAVEPHDRQIDPHQQPEVSARKDRTPAELTGAEPMWVAGRMRVTCRLAVTVEVVQSFALGWPVADDEHHNRRDDQGNHQATAAPNHPPARRRHRRIAAPASCRRLTGEWRSADQARRNSEKAL